MFDEMAAINQELKEFGIRMDVGGTTPDHVEELRICFNAEGKHDAVVLEIVVRPSENSYGMLATLTGKLNQLSVGTNVVAFCDLLQKSSEHGAGLR